MLNIFYKGAIRLLLPLVALLIFTDTTHSQSVTKVTGTIKDAKTGEALPFVNVTFINSYVGTTTDLDGKFSIDTRFPTDSLQASYLGYTSLSLPVKKGQKQDLIFNMNSESLVLESVTVSAKKKKYSKKNNPAVELIRKVMKNKKNNRIESNEFYSYNQYEKIQFDLNNITEQFMNRKLLSSFKFIFDYVDTSEVNGKPYLPMFLRESYSTVYYRKNPEAKKEYKHGIKLTEFADKLDLTSIDELLDVLYQNVNIYDNSIEILAAQFISPVAPIAPNFYRFYIQDTLDINGINCIRLAFIPKNKKNFGFTGDLYISNDDKYAIRKVSMGILGDINLNFVRDMKIDQEFDEIDGTPVLTRDEITVDYSIAENGLGFFGTRDISYEDYSFTEPDDSGVFGGFEKSITADGAFDQTDEYWNTVRLNPLSDNQMGLYSMVDSLKNLKAYKQLVGGMNIILSGFVPAGVLDIGPYASFVSFNMVEGLRLKLGGETNYNLSKKLFLKGYGAYGFKDKAWKYSFSGTYSLFKPYFDNPRDYISAGISRETSFPGRELDFFNEDNFLLSFQRGVTNRMLFSDTYFIDYVNEGLSFQYGLTLEHKIRRPYGALTLPYLDNQNEASFLDEIATTEIGVNFKFAPNEQFVQGRQYRTPIFNEHPVFRLTYKAGISDFLGGDYTYHKVNLNIFKRFYLKIVGHTNFEFEAGKTWGQLPYLLYFIPRANQTYAYQKRAYNMMNNLEFISDEFVSFQLAHFFNGFIFNRIPLWRELKLREVITAKVIFGRLTDENNPNLNPELAQFSQNEAGDLTTFTLNGTPYVETSFGFMNIFKFIRVDLVKRFTYLDNPNIPSLWGVDGLGIRGTFKVEF